MSALPSGAEWVLELSGGLDSSILASSLQRSRRPCSAATLVTPGRDADEREYARAVAEACGIELDEIPLSVSDVDLLAPCALARVSPGGFGMIAFIDRAHAAAADRNGAQAIVSGTGGDNVFCSLRSAAPVLTHSLPAAWDWRYALRATFPG